jgi:hypothetical protein
MSLRSIENALKNLSSPLASSQRDKVLVLNQSSTQNIDILETNNQPPVKSQAKLPHIGSRIDTISPPVNEDKNFAFQTKSIKILGDLAIDPNKK